MSNLKEQQEVERLQGIWRIVGHETDGKPDANFAREEMEFAGNYAYQIELNGDRLKVCVTRVITMRAAAPNLTDTHPEAFGAENTGTLILQREKSAPTTLNKP
jgi:hypothetical protein